MKRVIVGITGASGSVYGIRLLEALNECAETHLIVSESARKVIGIESYCSIEDVCSKANFVYDNNDLSCELASGSSLFDAMVIAPCSIKTLSAVAYSYAETLIARAADVMLKEHRQLVLAVRESPFHIGHLRMMQAVAEMGGIIAPPIPTFYNQPSTIEELVDQSVGRMLQLIGVESDLVRRWGGPSQSAGSLHHGKHATTSADTGLAGKAGDKPSCRPTTVH